MSRIDLLSRELSDGIEYLELGEAEGDATAVAEAEATIASLQATAERAELERCFPERRTATTAT